MKIIRNIYMDTPMIRYACMTYSPCFHVTPAILSWMIHHLHHWRWYRQMKQLAGGLKFIVHDADRLYQEIYETSRDDYWHLISTRKLSDGITRRLWISSLSGNMDLI